MGWGGLGWVGEKVNIETALIKADQYMILILYLLKCSRFYLNVVSSIGRDLSGTMGQKGPSLIPHYFLYFICTLIMWAKKEHPSFVLYLYFDHVLLAWYFCTFYIYILCVWAIKFLYFDHVGQKVFVLWSCFISLIFLYILYIYIYYVCGL